MAFSTPQAQDSPTYPAQALTDATDIAAVQAAGAGSVASGVVSGCAVTPNSSGVNLNVNVASGSVVVAGATVAVSAQTNITVSAASTHDRRDIVTVNSSGTASVTAGTPCSVAGWTTGSGVLGPVKPAIPASSVLIAEVYVPGASTSITASNLVAKAAPIGTSGAMSLIASQVLGSAAASITFSSIPQTFNHLRLMIVGRSATAAELDVVLIRFNGDTAANYDDQESISVNGAMSIGSDLAQTSARAFRIAAGSATANLAGSGVLDIPAYTLTTFQKTATGRSAFIDTTAANGQNISYGINWRSTAAITSIGLLLNSAANFVTGTAAYLYGVN